MKIADAGSPEELLQKLHALWHLEPNSIWRKISLPHVEAIARALFPRGLESWRERPMEDLFDVGYIHDLKLEISRQGVPLDEEALSEINIWLTVPSDLERRIKEMYSTKLANFPK